LLRELSLLHENVLWSLELCASSHIFFVGVGVLNVAYTCLIDLSFGHEDASTLSGGSFLAIDRGNFH